MIKKYLIIFHSLILTLAAASTFMDFEEMLVVTLPIALLIAIVILLLIKESKYILIPSILLIFIFTFIFALMVIGNIVWSEGSVLLVILAYLLFLTFEIVTIVFAFKQFKKQI